MLQAYKDLPYHAALRGALDGIPPHDARAALAGERFRRGVVSNVLMHARMEDRYSGTAGRDVKREMQQAGFGKQVMDATLGKLEKLVRGLEWKAGETAWTGYGEDNTYDEAAAGRKAQFVREAAARRRAALAWDVGTQRRHATRASPRSRPTSSSRSTPTTRPSTRSTGACATRAARTSSRSSCPSPTRRPTWAGAGASAPRWSAAGRRSSRSASPSCTTSASRGTCPCASSWTGCAGSARRS